MGQPLLEHVRYESPPRELDEHRGLEADARIVLVVSVRVDTRGTRQSEH